MKLFYKILLVLIIFTGFFIISNQFYKEAKIYHMEAICKDFNIKDVKELDLSYNILVTSIVISDKQLQDSVYMKKFINNMEELYNTKKIKLETVNFVPKWKIACITILKNK